jgi:nitrile hydratase subunit beta
MNGIHDMGGMQDMGAIGYVKSEPVFHAAWEARVYAMSSAVGATGKLRLGIRPPIENMLPVEYLRSSYYEKWLVSLEERMVASDLLSRAELKSGRSEKGSAKAAIAVSPPEALAALFRNPPTRREVAALPRFHAGQTVRTLNINPVTHTRLPRYARGKIGTIDLIHGAFVFADTSAYSLGDKPQYLYSVRFSARELWGEQALPQDAVYLDLYDDYLEPA